MMSEKFLRVCDFGKVSLVRSRSFMLLIRSSNGSVTTFQGENCSCQVLGEGCCSKRYQDTVHWNRRLLLFGLVFVDSLSFLKSFSMQEAWSSKERADLCLSNTVRPMSLDDLLTFVAVFGRKCRLVLCLFSQRNVTCTRSKEGGSTIF